MRKEQMIWSDSEKWGNRPDCMLSRDTPIPSPGHSGSWVLVRQALAHSGNDITPLPHLPYESPSQCLHGNHWDRADDCGPISKPVKGTHLEWQQIASLDTPKLTQNMFINPSPRGNLSTLSTCTKKHCLSRTGNYITGRITIPELLQWFLLF